MKPKIPLFRIFVYCTNITVLGILAFAWIYFSRNDYTAVFVYNTLYEAWFEVVIFITALIGNFWLMRQDLFPKKVRG